MHLHFARLQSNGSSSISCSTSSAPSCNRNDHLNRFVCVCRVIFTHRQQSRNRQFRGHLNTHSTVYARTCHRVSGRILNERQHRTAAARNCNCHLRRASDKNYWFSHIRFGIFKRDFIGKREHCR
uniref:Uncharacterized protein n=1 Tax=Anopheles atroparvus TaxID=41427 RepID=A0AAG5D8L6_ANOAO